MAPKGTLVAAGQLAQLRTSELERGLLTDRRALYDIERREEEAAFRHHLNLLLGLGVVALGAYVYLKIGSLGRSYPVAYEWWESSQALYAKSATTGADALVTVPSVALRLEFPSYYYLQTLLMTERTIPLAGAQFLMVMATHFSKELRPIHWDGSAEQLRFADIDAFLPPDASVGGGKSGINWRYVWTKWTATNEAKQPVNPWVSALFSSPQAMADSPAFQAYYGSHGSPPDRGLVRALFRGGLVEVAVQYGNVHTTGDKMAQRLMGVQSGATKIPCASRLDAAVQTSLEYGMYASMAGGMGGHAMASRLATSEGESKGLGSLVPLLVTVAGFGAGAAKGASDCKASQTSYSGLGAPPAS